MTADEAEAAAIPVLEENLRVDKTITETDRVFIRTSVLERTEYADLELRSGEAIIERVPVNRVVESAPAIRQQGDITIVPVVEEIMVVRNGCSSRKRSTSVDRNSSSTFGSLCGCAPRRSRWNGNLLATQTTSHRKRTD